MSNNLDIDQVAAGQNQKETTINDANGQLDAALTDTVTISVTSSNSYTLSNDEFRRYEFFTIDEDGGDPADADITLTVPAIKRGLFVIINDTAFTVTVEISGQSETAPDVATTDRTLLSCDGSDVRLAGGGGGGGSSTFLGLTDTPSSFSSQAGKVAAVNTGETALEFISVDVMSGAILPAFHGCLVQKNTDQLNITSSTWVDITFEAEVYDTGYDGTEFHSTSTNNERITIPAGVKRVRLSSNYSTDASADTNWGIRILKNNATVIGYGRHLQRSGFSNAALSVSTAVLNVTESDYFTVQAYAGGSGRDILNDDGTWFALEIIETESLADLGTENLIINGCFRAAQRGTSFTAATTPANNDDTYLLDRWVLLSDGNDIVDISQDTSVAPSGAEASMKSLVATANSKWGFVQIIEGKDAEKIIGRSASIQFKARTTTGAVINNIRAALISWSSTEDSVTSDVVSTWNASGVDPTLATNWTYENTPSNLGVTADSFSTHRLENISIDTASTENVALFIWVDDTDAAVNDVLYIADVKVNLGAIATAYEKRPFGVEENLVQRFYQKTFPAGTAPAQSAGNTGSLAYYALLTGVNSFSIPWTFNTRMRSAPTVTFYNPGAANANWRNITDAGDSAAGATLEAAEWGVIVSNAQVATDGAGEVLRIHATAESEL